jgi:hypothetical protein
VDSGGLYLSFVDCDMRGETSSLTTPDVGQNCQPCDRKMLRLVRTRVGVGKLEGQCLTRGESAIREDTRGGGVVDPWEVCAYGIASLRNGFWKESGMAAM